MMGAGQAAKAPPPAPPAAGAAGAAGPLPVMLPQARLPQPTVFDGTTLSGVYTRDPQLPEHQQLRVHTTNGLSLQPDDDYNDYSQREIRDRRRQETKETTTTGVATAMVCHRMCDYHHYSPEEEERLTTMVTTAGEMAQVEGCHDDATTRMTAGYYHAG